MTDHLRIVTIGEVGLYDDDNPIARLDPGQHMALMVGSKRAVQQAAKLFGDPVVVAPIGAVIDGDRKGAIARLTAEIETANARAKSAEAAADKLRADYERLLMAVGPDANGLRAAYIAGYCDARAVGDTEAERAWDASAFRFEVSDG